jgi:hypothetical protein
MSHGHEAGLYLWTRAVGPEVISTLLWAIDPSEEHTVRGLLVVEQFDRVAVDQTDHVSREPAGHGEGTTIGFQSQEGSATSATELLEFRLILLG